MTRQTPPPGWTASSWAKNLLRMADRIEQSPLRERYERRAKELRAWASRISTDSEHGR